MKRVCILAEGCYPYVVGGVSSWIQMLISGLPEYEFVIYAIGAEEKDRGNFKYKLPQNIVAVHEVFLDTVLKMNTDKRSDIHLTEQEKQVLLNLLLNKEDFHLEALLQIFREKFKKTSFMEIFMSNDFFTCIIQAYEEQYPHLAFTDYFWCVRSLLLPLFFLLQDNVPQADLYHSVATGYCGAIGALAAKVYGSPLLISEHGIYSREREEEIIKSSWVQGDLKNVWIQYFYQLSRIGYKNAQQVLALFSQSAEVEAALGCDPQKIAVVPNGVHLERFLPLQHQEDSEGWFNLGAVVRVVPIKDLMTMLRAFPMVKDYYPKTRLYIMGNQEENIEYYEECVQYVRSLGLKDVIFTGSIQVTEYLPKMDVLLLSSISEGMPLAVLEGMTAGVPFVTTNVGCCQELLYKCAPDDDFGPAGRIVPVMDFEGMAEAIIELLSDRELRHSMGVAGRKRAQKYFSYERFIASYRDYYQQLISKA